MDPWDNGIFPTWIPVDFYGLNLEGIPYMDPRCKPTWENCKISGSLDHLHKLN